MSNNCKYCNDDFCYYYERRAIDESAYLKSYIPKCENSFCPILNPNLLKGIKLVEKDINI